jgi:RND superfamily putative drug exporter
MLTRLAEFLVRRRRRVLVTAVIGFLAAGVGGGNVAEHLSGGGFEDPGAESTQATDILNDSFDQGEPNVVLLVTAEAGSVDAGDVAAAGTALTEEIGAEEGVDAAVSYWSLGSPPPLRSRDGSQALVLARIAGSDDEVDERVEEIGPKYARPANGVIKVEVGGMAETFRQMGSTIEADLGRAELLALPFILVLLVLVFGSVVAATLPLAVGILAIIGAFLGIRVIAAVTDVSIFALSLITFLGLGLAIDYSLFIVSRFREELRRGLEPHAAVVRTVQTAGRTVLFGAATVAISLSALLIFPMYFLRSFAYGGIAVVAVSAVSAVIVLPALLAVLGHRVDKWVLWHRPTKNVGEGFWHRIALLVMRRPISVGVAVTAFLLFLGSPFLGINLGLPDDRVLPEEAKARQVNDQLRANFSSFEASALSVVAPGVDAQARAADIGSYATALSRQPGVARVDAASGAYVDGQQVLPATPASARFVSPAGTWLSVVPSVEPISPEGEELVRDIRASGAPFETKVTGPSAQLVDSKDSMFSRLPIAGGLIALVTFTALFMMFGSLLVPLKAVVLNILSLTATFGAMVWLFQDGHLSGLLDFTATGTIDTTTPILMFCIAFGLSMDYEVFLLSRIKEEHDRTGDNVSSVAIGLERTGRIVTAAAVLMALAFFAMATSRVSFIKLFGVGLATAVLMDATLIRAALVPAFMRLAGEANWWAPGPLRRFYQRYGIHELDEVTTVMDLTDGYKGKLMELAAACESDDELHALLEVEGISRAELEAWRVPAGSSS